MINNEMARFRRVSADVQRELIPTKAGNYTVSRGACLVRKLGEGTRGGVPDPSRHSGRTGLGHN